MFASFSVIVPFMRRMLMHQAVAIAAYSHKRQLHCNSGRGTPPNTTTYRLRAVFSKHPLRRTKTFMQNGDHSYYNVTSAHLAV